MAVVDPRTYEHPHHQRREHTVLPRSTQKLGGPAQSGDLRIVLGAKEAEPECLARPSLPHLAVSCMQLETQLVKQQLPPHPVIWCQNAQRRGRTREDAEPVKRQVPALVVIEDPEALVGGD